MHMIPVGADIMRENEAIAAENRELFDKYGVFVVNLMSAPGAGKTSVLERTIRALKEQGFTILLVEQNFRFASTVADRYYVMEHGRVVESFTNEQLEANLDKLHEYLGV